MRSRSTCIFLLAALYVSLSPRPGTADGDLLQAERPVCREIAGNELHIYRISIGTSQFLHVAIEQIGVDLAVRVTGPGADKPEDFDVAEGLRGRELVSWIAPLAGEVSVEVKLAGTGAPGFYQIEVLELREAVWADEWRVEAERGQAGADRLRKGGSKESIQASLAGFEKTLLLWRDLGDLPGEAATLTSLGAAHKSLGRYPEALASYERALTIRREIGDTQGESDVENLQGETLYYLGRRDEALEHFESALRLRNAAGDLRGQAETLNNIGGIRQWQGSYRRAIQSYEDALVLWRTAGDRRGEAATLTNLGIVRARAGDIEKALDLFSQGLTLRRTIGDRGSEANTLHNMGTVYAEAGEAQRAIDFYQTALPAWKALGDRRGEAATLGNLAGAYGVLGDHGRAVELYEQVLELRRQLGDRRGEATTLVNLGKSRAAIGEWDRASSDLQAALDLSVAAKDKLAEMRACLQLGIVESKTEQLEAATASLRRGLELSQSLENPAAEATARYGLARLQRACGDMKAARTEIENAVEIVESIRTKILSRDLRASFLGSMRENYELYVQILMEMATREPENGYAVQAFEASERARARSLIELLGEAGSAEASGATAESVDARNALQVRIDRKVEERLRLLAGEHTEEQAEQGRREIEMILAEYERLEARIRSASARQDERVRPEPLSLVAIREQALDADTVLLEYSLGEERSYLWIVSIDSLKSVQLPGRSEITAVARRAYEAASVRGVPAAKELADVARVVLDPAGDLGGKRLVVVGDGVLHYVPFAALPEAAAGGTPLVTRHEIVHVPSASTLALQRRELAGRARPPKTLALFADPVFGADDERVTGGGAHPAGISGPIVRSAADAGFANAGIPRLPFTRREADAILRLVPRSQSRAALDFDATRLSATGRDLEQYRFLHFATHCFLDSTRPQLTGIVLSLVDRAGHPLEGFLTPHDAAGLKLSADLVVLSGCRTALGKEVWGEGLVGLTRAFFSAGAARVTASLWRVDDSATADLMARFYRAMLAAPGMPPAAALREAQLALLKERRWQDPYFWAAFQLHGDWR